MLFFAIIATIISLENTIILTVPAYENQQGYIVTALDSYRF